MTKQLSSEQAPGDPFRDAVENGFDSVWILSLPSFQLVYVNKDITEAILGHPAEAYSNDPNFWLSIVAEEDRDIALRANQKCLASGFAESTLRMIRRDGSKVWVKSRLKLIKDSNGNPVRIIGTTMDLTTSKDSEEKMLYASKMSSLGEMAGGIAHEINNPLAIIHGRAEQLTKKLLKKQISQEEVIEGLMKISQTTMRIAKNIKGLRSFSRDSNKDPFEQTDLEQIIDDTLSLCQEKFKQNGIELRLNIPRGIKCNCRPSQISQVLLNLLTNSFDAIVDCTEKWIEINVNVASKTFKIRVVDSGRGIPAEIADQVMLPFFTTKDPGKGTGLGLSISKGIIESHHGRLYIDTNSPNTCLVIELPLVDGYTP